MMRKARQKIAKQQAVMMTVDAVTPYYFINTVDCIGQVFQAGIMEFMCGNAGP